VQEQIDDPPRQAVLDELRRLAVEAYGEDRAAEMLLQAAVEVAATAVWRVSQEVLEPVDEAPAR
jgi:hypothetical protein